MVEPVGQKGEVGTLRDKRPQQKSPEFSDILWEKVQDKAAHMVANIGERVIEGAVAGLMRWWNQSEPSDTRPRGRRVVVEEDEWSDDDSPGA